METTSTAQRPEEEGLNAREALMMENSKTENSMVRESTILPTAEKSTKDFSLTTRFQARALWFILTRNSIKVSSRTAKRKGAESFSFLTEISMSELSQMTSKKALESTATLKSKRNDRESGKMTRELPGTERSQNLSSHS
jgi:hypothetical protein